MLLPVRINAVAMEKLKRVQVSGFKSIRELDLELGDLTVLIGANGSGKSNFVDFFNMLSFMLTESLQLYVGRHGGGSSILHYGPKRSPILRAELDFLDDRGTSEYGFTLAFASPDGLLFTDEHLGFRYVERVKPFEAVLGAGHFEAKLVDLGRNPGQMGATARKVSRVFVTRLRELRVYHFHDTSEQAYIRTKQDIDRNRDLMSNGGNLASFLHMLGYAWPHHYERIITTIRVAVPFLQGVVLEPDRIDPSRVQLRWTDRNPDYEFGPHQLSDGSLRAIALITALMQPDDLLPSVIFIDEPELGLHPSAVGLIGSLIKAVSAKRQVVVATQSPRLLAEFSPEDVVVVERHEDEKGYGESKFKRLTREELGAWLDDYDLGALYEMNVTGGGPQ